MIYPNFLKNGDTIGICAPSAGIGEGDFAEFDLSLSHLHRAGWSTKETASVRSGLDESAPPETRGAEFNALANDKDVRAILCASGGDFLISMLPHIDADAIKSDPKWIQGYSDPTSLLYYVTTALDVATIYGVNAGGFWMETLHPSLSDGIRILKGDVPTQHSFYFYERDRSGRNGGYNRGGRREKKEAYKPEISPDRAPKSDIDGTSLYGKVEIRSVASTTEE